jgi:hypothetical protein
MVGIAIITLRPPYEHLYECTVDRIMFHYNLPTLDKDKILAIVPEFVARTTAEAASVQCMEIFHISLPRLINAEQYSWDEEYVYRRALNEGCKLGYLWANAEAEFHMKPLAIAGLKSRERAKTAGEKAAKLAETSPI